MPRTDHNLKLLEKKVRQAASLIAELKKARSGPQGAVAPDAEPRPKSSSYRGLPLLQSLAGQDSLTSGEKDELRARIIGLMNEIERFIG